MIIPFGIKYSDSCHNMNLETQANNEKEYFCSHHFLTVLKKLCTFKNKMRLPERPHNINQNNQINKCEVPKLQIFKGRSKREIGNQT